MAIKVCNTLSLNRSRLEIDKILKKNQNVFRRNRSTTSQILTIRLIIDRVQAKNFEAIQLLVDFCKTFDSIHKRNMKQILLAYGPHKEIVTAIKMLYKNAKAMVRSPGGDTDLFAGVLQGKYISTIFIYTLRRLCTLNIYRSNQRKWFHF